MSRWQDAGVVQDSDDEELPESITTLSSPLKPSTAEPDQAGHDGVGGPHDSCRSSVELERPVDLQMGKEVTRPALNWLSSDSELSDVPEGLHSQSTSPGRRMPFVEVVIEQHVRQEDRFGFNDFSDHLQHPNTYSGDQGVQLSNTEEQALLQQNHDNTLTQALSELPRRNLRKRNDIQLHPYLLEQQQYLKQCLARGVKPVRIRLEDTRAAPPNAIEDTQDRATPGSQSTQSSEGLWRLDSSASESQTRPRKPLSSSSQPDDAPFVYADGELPEMADLLRSRVSTKVHLGSKRRKISHSRTIGRPFIEQAFPRRQLGTPTQDASRTVFDYPTSPHREGTSPFRQSDISARKGFQVPPSLPPPLPTPTTAIRPRKHTGLDSDESEDEPVLPTRSTGQRKALQHNRRPTSEPASPTTDPDDSDLSEVSEILRVQRRIRGVLPASWLRLDLQAQAKLRRISGSPQRDRSGAHHEQSKGVAKKVIRPQSRSSGSRTTPGIPFDIDGDSDEASGGSQLASSPSQPTTTPEKHQQHLRDSIFLDDVEEDNTIDAMLPAQSRGTRKPKPVTKRDKKRQSKLPYVSGTARLQYEPRVDHGQSRVTRLQLPAKSTRRRHRPPQFKPPRLSILDVEESENHKSEEPQFVRLAKRASRQREDLGRTSPGSKLIRLQTAADTEDAHTVLRRWNGGNIQPRAAPRQQQSKRPTRPSLAVISHNVQQPLPYLAEVSRGETNEEDSEALFARPRPQTSSVAKGLQQSRLNRKALTQLSPIHAPPAAPTNPAVPTTEVRPRIERRVLAKRTGIRDAQLEAPALPSSGLPQEDFTLARFLHQTRIHRDRVGTSNEPDYGPDVPQASSNVSSPTTLESRIIEKAQQIKMLRRKTLTRRPKKRPGRQVDVAANEFEQLLQPILPASAIREPIEIDDGPITQDTGLHGLPPAGTSFTVNFDVAQLSQDTHFPENTFIGSGELNACLRFSQRDLNLRKAAYTIPRPDGYHVWSAWDEVVAGELRSVMTQICLLLEGSQRHGTSEDSVDGIALLRHVVKFVATTVHFTDSSDRASFVCCLSEQAQILRATLTVDTVGAAVDRKASARMLLLALECMVSRIARSIEAEETAQLERWVEESARSVFASWSEAAVDHLQLSDNSRRSRSSQGGASEHVVESLVATHHLLGTYNKVGVDIWSLANEAWLPILQDAVDINIFERVWAGLLSVIPLLKYTSSGGIDKHGSVKVDWSLPKSLITRVLSLYASTTGRTASLNAYVRTLLVRCYHLLAYWSWDCPEGVLYAWLDFFAARKLSGLHLEDAKGSLTFLENLHGNPDLEPASDDSTFQMFLKFLAKALLSLRSVYSDRKIQGIVWRFVPAHGRTYPKESSLAQEALEALRNHHDLLSVLYWASPAGHRPRLDLLRNLVDHSASHRETCRLSVRAWSNLVRYQASIDEPQEALEPFIGWLRDMLTNTVAQYRMARSEAESQQAAWKAQGDKHFTFEYVSRIVERNQRQVLATLAETISGLRSAVAVSVSEHTATALIRDSCISTVLSLFSERSASVSNVVIDVFKLYQTYLSVWNSCTISKRSSNAADESQDYGDWPGLDADVEELEDNLSGPTVATPSTMLGSLDLIVKPLQQYLSDIFGSQEAPDVASTEAALETLVNIAKLRIDAHESDWTAYLDPYGAHSWDRLGTTESARRFGPFFYALAVKSDPRRTIARPNASMSVGHHEEAIYSTWLTSMVEQESKLAYQHTLTETLLNSSLGIEVPLLHNLPFWTRSNTATTRDRGTDEKTYAVTMQEIRDRRLSLLSTVFANMRREFHNPLRQADTQSMYRRLLRKVMAAMKTNYLDHKQLDIAQARYTAFIHEVLGLLVQHTTEICPIDTFFTDGLAFPLSAEDPTYVVAKLKSYVPKLGVSKFQKEFSTFLHNLLQQAVSNGERAASTFVDRLHSVMSEGYVHGELGTPSMVAVIVGGMLPAYLEGCFQNGKGYIVAQTFLTIALRVFRNILTRVSMCRELEEKLLGALITDFLDTATVSLLPLLAEPAKLNDCEAVRTLVLLVEAVRVLSPTVDYLVRLRLLLPEAWKFIDLVGLSSDHLVDPANQSPSDLLELACRIQGRPPRLMDRFKELRQFAHRSVQQGQQDAGHRMLMVGTWAEQRLSLREAVSCLKGTTATLTSNGKHQRRQKTGCTRELADFY